jgi:hypothetical protein
MPFLVVVDASCTLGLIDQHAIVSSTVGLVGGVAEGLPVVLIPASVVVSDGVAKHSCVFHFIFKIYFSVKGLVKS